ncbi:MAG: hypothetical protein ACREF9_11120 [Opitutaceae bacterium]
MIGTFGNVLDRLSGRSVKVEGFINDVPGVRMIKLLHGAAAFRGFEVTS